MLPDGVHARVQKNSYEVPVIFKMLQSLGCIEERIMYNTYNMGVGMVLAVSQEDVAKTIEAISKADECAFVIGEIVSGDKGVTLC